VQDFGPSGFSIVEMPNDAAARETGFGTGLLAHLGKLDEPVAAEPPAAEPAPAPETVADDHELLVAAHEAALQQALRRVAELEAALTRREQPAPEASTRPAAVVLRERAEREAERLWRAFDAALDATFPDGRPDVRTRLEAAETLLAQLELADAVTPPDELALRRDLRVGRLPG
jgi:hypothetical protein